MTESTLAAVARAAAEQMPATATQQDAPVPPAASTPPAPDSAALASARAEGIKAERERCKAILTAEAAEGRSDLAAYFAFDTEMAAAQAVAALDKAPKTSGENSFAAAMRTDPVPNIGSGAGAAAPSEAPGPSLAEMMKARCS